MATNPEHQEYIQKKVNPILESLVTAVLLDRPEEPVGYMINWLKKQDSNSGSSSTNVDELRAQYEQLVREVKELEDDDEEEDDDDDDVVDDMPPPPLNKKPRTSVSAEAYGKWNQKKEYTPIDIPKSDEAKQRIRAVLTRSFLFSGLSDKDANIVVGAMEEIRLEAGHRIINQGDDGDCLYVIEEGVLHCKIRKPDGDEIIVKTCQPGDAFGELALLYNCPRAASVDSDGDALLWKLDRETFNAIVKDAAAKKRESYEAFLKKVPLLESLTQYDRSQLADTLMNEEFPAGTVLINEGEIGDKFYMIEEGCAFAFKGSDETSVKDYDQVGDFFGELAILKDEPRAASVKAKTDVKLVCCDRKTFKRMLGPLDEIMARYARENY